MRKLPIILLSILLTGCATVPDPDQVRSVEGQVKQKYATDLVKSLLVIGAIAYVANEVGDKQHKSKCNNRAGFYTVNGQIYTCK